MLTNIVIDPFLLSKNFAFSRCPQWDNRWMISHITSTSMGISGTFWHFKAAKNQEILKKDMQFFGTWGEVINFGRSQSQQEFLEIQDNQFIPIS